MQLGTFQTECCSGKFPVTSTRRRYDTVPYTSSEASEKWWIWEECSSPKPSGFTDRGNATPLMLGRSITHLAISSVAHPGSSRPSQILACRAGDRGLIPRRGARRIQDETVRLSYLIQDCTGVAQEAVANCVILPPKQGYREARAILKNNFGQQHIIVRAFIDKVVCGPQIKASEPEKLLKLAREMKNCVLNSIQMKYEADIDSIDTLKKVSSDCQPTCKLSGRKSRASWSRVKRSLDSLISPTSSKTRPRWRTQPSVD